MSAGRRGLRDTVQLLVPAMVTDTYTEDEKPDWTQPAVTETTSPATVQPLSSTEAVLTAGTVISRWRLFLPAFTVIESIWRVRWDGDDYDVDGEIEDRSPALVRCFLKRVAG